MSTIQPYSVNKKKPRVNALVFGPPGAGKTTFAASAARHPDMSPVLFLNHEGGLISVAGLDNVDAVDVRTVDQLEEVFAQLMAKKPPWDKYKTVVIDSGSELQALDLEQTAREAYEKDQKRNGARAKRASVDDLWQEDYGKNTARLRRLFRWFRDAPFHVVITALAKRNYSKVPAGSAIEPKLIDVVPSFTDKLGQSVMGYCDFVWYFYSKRVHRKGQGKDVETEIPTGGSVIREMLTQEHGPYRAKTRGHKFAEALGPVVKNPDLADLYQLLIKSEYKTDTSKGEKK